MTDDHETAPTGQHAMQDHRIIERLQACPEDPDAQLDAALDGSMDASDPVSIAQPARAAEPPTVDGQNGEEPKEPEVRSNA